ncbi:MAG: hypothetical protein RJA98_693 [Pseudomonadota bacterium]|jgi:hypothetical protein
MFFRISAISLAVLSLASGAAQAQTLTTGPSSSASPYVQGLLPGMNITSILTTGDNVGGYRMAGIPDGLGAYDNGNGTFTVLMNHELGSTLGAVHAHGATGAFVSEWVINKSDLSVVSGGDLIKNVYGWNSATQTTGSLLSGVSFNRFCSADLSPTTAYYNAATGLGTTARIFMSGEEGGATGYEVATVATGANKGNSYILGGFNLATNGSGATAVGGWENALANPYAQDKTIVIGNNDGGTGIMNNSVAVYVGTKTNTGSDVDRAGLTNGVLKFINVDGNTAEIANATTRATNIANGTHFSLSSTASTTFSRPEDGAWSADGKTYYFATTDRLDQTELTGNTTKGSTRLWSLSFDDIANPDAGGKISLVVDGGAFASGSGKPNMFDNISVNADGTLTLQEDTGGAAHNGKIWQFDPATGKLVMIAKSDALRFGDVVGGAFVAGSLTNDEETSGVIDITSILGKNDGQKVELFVMQNHKASSDPTLVEGGQLMVMSVAAVPEPETYALMLAGLATLGAVTRRSSKRKTQA